MSITTNQITRPKLVLGSVIRKALISSGASIGGVVLPEPYTLLQPSTGLTNGFNLNRPTTATVIDYEGIIRTAKAGELRVEKARRVENLLIEGGNVQPYSGSSAVYESGVWTLTIPNTAVVRFYKNNFLTDGKAGRSYTASFEIKSQSLINNIRIDVNEGNKITTSSNTEWSKSEVTGTNLINDYLFVDIQNSSGAEITIQVKSIQIEDVTGQADQTASEYVSNGVLSYPYHGAGVDGVKYFDTKKDGSPLDEEPYILVEKQGTNILLNSDNTYQASNFFKDGIEIINYSGYSNVIGISSQKGIGHFLQTTSGVVTESFSVKKVSGSSTIKFDLILRAATDTTFSFDTNSFSNINPVFLKTSVQTQPNGWLRLSLTYDYGNVGIAIKEIDNILLKDWNVENSNYSSSYIPTSETAVTRSADVLKYEFGAGNFPQEFCYYTDIEPLEAFNTTSRLFGSQDSRGNTYEPRAYYSGGYDVSDTIPAFNLGGYSSTSLDQVKFGLQISTNQKIFINGLNERGESNIYAFTFANTGTLEIANWAGSVMPMKIYNVAVYPALTDEQLAALTEL